MTSDQKQYINFSKKFDELASDIDDIRELVMEVLKFNQDIINEISQLNLTLSLSRYINESSIKGDKTKSKKKKKSKSESE